MIDPIKKNFLINSFLSILLLFGIAWQLNHTDGYYHWFCNNLIKTNFQYIYNSSHQLTYEQKNKIKLGKSYDFLELIRESTPRNAIILFPPDHIFEDNSNLVKFNGYMNRKGYVTYFLYPRKVVYENERHKNPLYDKISHVAIVNNWGYDKLKYSVTEEIPYSVLSIDDPSLNFKHHK